MGSYTVIQANQEQANMLFEKHLKPKNLKSKRFCFFGKDITKNIERICDESFSYDDEDNIGFVKLKTITGKKVEYQLRGDRPCFVEFSGFGNIRYDISYPERLNQELYDFLKEYGLKNQKNFWAGGQI